MDTPEPQWRDRLESLESTLADVLARLEGLEQAWMRDMEHRRRSAGASAPAAPEHWPGESPMPFPSPAAGKAGLAGPSGTTPVRLSSLAYPAPDFPAQKADTGAPSRPTIPPSPPVHEPAPRPAPSAPPPPAAGGGPGLGWGRSGADAPFASSKGGSPTAERSSRFPGQESALDRLRQWGMAPPEGSGNMETHLAMWWFTRLGALALVIGFAFAGTYISQYTSPWQRLLGLVTTSIGITVLGANLKGQLEEFGHVVFGTGLAMLYFCAFAAHVVPAVKVIDQQGVAAFWQFAAVGLMVGAALWRRSPVMATMAVLLGYVSCGFALMEEMSEFALVAALLLGGGAMWFHLGRRWTEPLIVAIPASLVVFLAVLNTIWAPADAARPDFWSYMLRVLAFALVFAGGNCLGEWRGVRLPPWTGRVLMSLNSFGFLGLGFVGVVFMHEAQLSSFYFVTGAVWAALAVAHHLSPHPGGMVDLYLIKGSALISLGVITEFDARTRWIVLAIQSLATYFSVRRTRAVVMEGFMALVWITSFLFFFHDVERMGLLAGPQAGEPLPVGYLLAGLGYVVLSLNLFCLYGRWIEREKLGVNQAIDLTPVRHLMLACMAVALGYAVIFLVRMAVLDAWLAPCLVLAALALAATCLAGRHWSPVVASVLPLLAGNIQVWDFDIAAHGVTAAWFASLSATALTLAAAGGAALATARLTLHVFEKRRAAVGEGVLHLLWMVTLSISLHRLMSPEGFILVLSALSLALLAASPVLPWRGVTRHSLAPLALAAVALVTETSWTTPMAPWALAGALLCVLAFAILATSPEPRFAQMNQPMPEGVYIRLLIPTVVIVIAFILTGLFATPVRLAGYVAVVAALTVAAPMLRAPRVATMSLALITLAHLLAAATLLAGLAGLTFREGQFFARVGLSGWDFATTTGFLMALLLAAATLALAALVRRWATHLSRDLQDLLQGLGGLVFLIVVFLLFLVQDGFRYEHATVFWGLGAIAVLLTGFAVDGRDLRLLGLGALLLCLVRAFSVDIQSQLARIFAFIILGLVMLFVGLLYTRRQSRSEDSSGD